MREEKIYGVALILSACGMLATAGFHPTGLQLLASAQAVAHVGFVNKVVHGIALGSGWLSFVGVFGLSRRLGLQRIDVTGAITAFAMAMVALTCAAVTDGIVASEVARATLDADDAARDTMLQLLRYSGLVASSMTRFYVAAAAAAILLWSIAMLRTEFNRALAWVGGAIALGGLAAQFSGHLRMDAHDLAIVVVAQSIWIVWTGVALIRQRGTAAALDVS